MIFAKIHPLVVHFPVALLVSGVVFEYYGRFQNEITAREAGRFNIRFGFWWTLAVVAVGLGGLFELELRENFRTFLTYHITLAGSTLIIFGAAVALLRWGGGRPWVPPFYWILITLGLFCVLGTGYFGGELVHRFGVATPHPVP